MELHCSRGKLWLNVQECDLSDCRITLSSAPPEDTQLTPLATSCTGRARMRLTRHGRRWLQRYRYSRWLRDAQN